MRSLEINTVMFQEGKLDTLPDLHGPLAKIFLPPYKYPRAPSATGMKTGSISGSIKQEEITRSVIAALITKHVRGYKQGPWKRAPKFYSLSTIAFI